MGIFLHRVVAVFLEGGQDLGRCVVHVVGPFGGEGGVQVVRNHLLVFLLEVFAFLDDVAQRCEPAARRDIFVEGQHARAVCRE